ncbi:hypothetical protein F383_07031 [Gossypium arboreum]|uniref:Uncharacterized protein n=1 Tax=Gossypium arboreum TaxID=29729 RepID=A0A0B0NUG0_GOSAR|nr:hypothetical protein F383_07031 [Gossypium arboreum]
MFVKGTLDLLYIFVFW